MKRLLAFLVTCLVATSSFATDAGPDALVKSVTAEVLDAVRKDADIRNGNSQKTLDLVETKVLPHFNFLRMTRLALGRDGRQATPDQIKVLADEFRTLLVRTYSKALTEFRDQQISFRPFNMKPGETDVRVRTDVKQSGGKPIPMDYYLEKTPNGWKVYDMEVGGVSLVTNYRSTFSQEIRASGIDGLIHSLQTKNQSGTSAQAK